MSPTHAPVTYPSPKYGPTPEYGECEVDEQHAARMTCPDCDGHFCFAHAEHDRHAEHVSHAGASAQDTRTRRSN